MRRLMLAFILVFAACGGAATTGAPTPDAAAACDDAFAAAAGVAEMADSVSDLYPAIRACSTVADWSAAFAAHSGAGFTGPPTEVLRNACMAAEVSGEPLCTATTPTPRAAADIPTLLTETIDEACTKPAEPWCKYLKKAKGLYWINATESGSITVQTVIPNTAAGKKLAAALCTYLGAVHFDSEGVRLDYNHIHISRGDTEQADCNAADY
jgi:hypothetical protein